MNQQFADPAGRYHLDSVIATGGMGVVWRGTDTRLNRPVAVKVLKAEYAEDPLFRTRFEQEARSAGALHHPGIAGVYDYGAGDSEGGDSGAGLSPYLVMELVDGQPLSSLLATARGNERTLDTAVVQDLIAQTGEALGVAHRAGIVHRDVKPANLLVTPDRRVKITDFGIARAADAVALTRTGSVMGTPQYLSPEQARGNPSTPASDVYSLGVVAFECLTGRRPFEAETPVATALAHLQQPVPDLPASVPAGLAAVVKRALSKEPSERYADGSAFAAAFRAGTGGIPIPPPDAEDGTRVLPSVTGPVPTSTPRHTPVPPVPTPPVQPMRRLDSPAAYGGDQTPQRQGKSPWPAAIAVIVLVIAAVAVAALLIGQNNDDDPVAQDTTSAPTTAETTESSSEPASETTSEDTTVQVNEDDYSCSADYRDAVVDLRALGLQVSSEQSSTPNDGTCPADTVERFSRNGTLNEGDAIVVYFYGPVETPTEETTVPTDATTPTEELPSLPGDDG